MKIKLVLLVLQVTALAHAQIPWKLEPFLEYFGTVRGSVLGARVKGFAGSYSNNPYNVAVVEGYNPTLEVPRLFFYSISSPQDTTPRWIISGGENLEHGDFNGDGFTDLAVHKSVNVERNDTVLVYLGHASGIDTLPRYKLPAEREGTHFGAAMCVGDLNNDGIDDLVVTARGYKTYVYFGGPSLKSTPDITIPGNRPLVGLGWRCASGDFNDDGYNDLAIRGLDQTNSNLIFGYLNLYFGSAAAFDTVADLTSPRSYRTIVSGLAAFDANADGKTDLLWAFLDSLTSKQSVFVHYGGTDFAARFQAGPDFVIPAPFGSGEFGNEITNAGDMNGDGDDDIVIAAYTTAQGNGIVFVYAAGKALDDQFDAARGQSRQGAFGASIDRVGDINEDGLDDIIVGAPDQPWLRRQGYFGIFLGDSRILTGVTSRGTETPPSDFALFYAHPNPFSNVSLIQFSLPQQALVNIKIYDILGKEVMRLLDSQRFAGEHQVRWNGRTKTGEALPVGVYFVRLQAFSPASSQLLFDQTRKITAVK